jgi:hypothetical protein
MKVEITLNELKRGIELFFSEELTKELANRLKGFGFKQGFRDPLKWYAPQHPAFVTFAGELKEALLKGRAFLSVHIQPSFSPTQANIDHNKFSYVTISYNKNAKKEQESFVLFDSYKVVATAIATRYGKNKYRTAFKGVDVSPRNYKRKARALLKEGKVIAEIKPEASGKDDFTNQQGVYTPELAGERYVVIDIPIPKTAKYNAQIATVLGEDKLYRSAFSAHKQFGDFNGSTSPISENDPTFDSWPSAIQGAATKLIEHMVTDLNSPDSILNNETKKKGFMTKALEAVRNYLSTEYHIELNEPKKEHHKALPKKENPQATPQKKNNSLEQLKGKDFEIIEKAQEVSPLYHGTCLPFKRFEKQYLGTKTGDIPSHLGYHFTPNQQLAATIFANDPHKDSYEDCRFIEVGLKVKKTLKTTEEALVKNVLLWGIEQGIITERTEELLELLKLPYVTDDEKKEQSLLRTIESDQWYNNNKQIINYEILGIRYLNEVLKPQGLDSILYQNAIEWSTEGRYDWIVFDEEQIIYRKTKYVGKTIENQPKKQNKQSPQDQLIDLGFNGFFSAQDAFDKAHTVIDLQTRWENAFEFFANHYEEPSKEQIKRWETVIEALKGEKGKESKKQKKLLQEKIIKKTNEVARIKTLIKNELVDFEQAMINQAIERAKKAEHLLSDSKEIQLFSITISDGLFDEKTIAPYRNKPIPEITDQLIQGFFKVEKEETLFSAVKGRKNNDVYETFLAFESDVIYQLEVQGDLTTSDAQGILMLPQTETIASQRFIEKKNLTPIDAKNIAAEILELSKVKNDQHELIIIPIPENAKYKAQIELFKNEDGYYNFGLFNAKKFGDLKEYYFSANDNESFFKNKKDAIAAAIGGILIRITAFIQRKDSTLNNEEKKKKILTTAFEAVKQYAKKHQIEPDFEEEKAIEPQSKPPTSNASQTNKAKGVDILLRDETELNVLVPSESKEPFISGSLYVRDAKKIQEASPNLLLLNDNELSEATAVELFELSQMPHPTDYGFKIKRGTLLKEWETRGEEVFEELGFPTDLAYPYVNLHGGYTSVYPLSQILTSKGDSWWAVVEHYRPIADTSITLLHIEQSLRVLENDRLETINPKTNKPKAQAKEKYRKLTWDINGLLESKLQIEKYRRSPPKELDPKNKKSSSNSKQSATNDIRSKLSLEEFIEYGSIGFDKLSAYKSSAVRKAKQVMAQAIQLGYAIPYDFGKGKGKYTTTKEADKMSFRDLFTHVYNNIHLDKLLPSAKEKDEIVTNDFLFTPEKDIPKQRMKDCEGENQAGDTTMFSCVNVMVLGKGYQGWNYTPFLGLQIILRQINASLTEFVKELEKVTGEDWSWLNNDLGDEMDLYTKKPRRESYYISTTATVNDLLSDLIAANFSEVKHLFEEFLLKNGVKPKDVISALNSKETKPTDKKDSKKAKAKNDYLDRVVANMHEKYAKGERPTKGYIQRLATELNVPNMGMMWEAAELSWLLWYKQIYREPTFFEERLENMIYFWNKLQPTYAYSDSSKEIYKQYSTPCPIGAIIAQYTEMDNAKWIFEPSAGNGLLLVGADPRKTHVNEIDHSRMASLKFQGFNKYTNFNAAQPFPEEMSKQYDVMVTNPPFARWDETPFDKERIIRKYFNSHVGLEKHIRLEHLMSGLALQTIKDAGKAAIIIMGHVYFGDDGFIAKYRPFFNWLYRNYHVNDIINMNSFKLYNKQGAIEKTMLILIGGRKSEPKGVAPTQKEAAHLYDMVNSFSELWNRVKPFTEYTLDNIIQQLEIAIAA